MENITLINEGNQFVFTQISAAEGFEDPDRRVVVEDISGPASAIYITSKFGRRPLSWRGILSGDVLSQRRNLTLVTRLGNLKTLKFTTCDDVAVQTEVEITKVLMPYRQGRQPVLIEAVAPDWRFYSQTEHTNDSASAEQTIENLGTEATDPVFVIEGPFTAVTVRNLSSGESFTITETITTGHWIEVDVANRTVKYDGDTSIYSSFDGEFFRLIPSDNVIQFDPTGDSGATSLVTTWRDAYVGI